MELLKGSVEQVFVQSAFGQGASRNGDLVYKSMAHKNVNGKVVLEKIRLGKELSARALHELKRCGANGSLRRLWASPESARHVILQMPVGPNSAQREKTEKNG